MAAAEQPLNSCHHACHLPCRLWARSSLSEPTHAQIQLGVRNLTNLSLDPRVYFAFWGKCKAESEDPLTWYTISNSTEKGVKSPAPQHQRMWSLRPWSPYSMPCPPEPQSLRRSLTISNPDALILLYLLWAPASTPWAGNMLLYDFCLYTCRLPVFLASPSLFFRSQASQRTPYCSPYLP